MDLLFKKIKNKIWNHLKTIFYYERVTDSQIVQNINYSGEQNQKAAIICYLTRCHFLNLNDTSKGRTQPYEILIIEEVLSFLGYKIDIINCNDIRALTIIKNNKYDLIFGFGDTFYQLTEMNPYAISILYMTENPPEFSFKKEKERLDYYFIRHKRKFSFTRSGKFYKIEHFQKKYSSVITMGETELLNKHYNNPHFIYPTGLKNSNYYFSNKNHIKTRKHFLWFGSVGAVHKGLDLLLDVFSQQDDIIIHICGLGQEEKKQLYIPKKNNIIEYGHVDINSDIFLNLVNKCSYIILLSCSEGCSTSILTGMLHGLIPVVLKDVGFNKLGENAIFFEDYKIEYIKVKLNELALYSTEELKLLSKRVYEFARINFTINSYKTSLKKILLNILNDPE